METSDPNLPFRRLLLAQRRTIVLLVCVRVQITGFITILYKVGGKVIQDVQINAALVRWD